MTAPKLQLTFKLKTLFMGSDGTVPQEYARTTEKKNLTAWIDEGLIEHRPAERIYALTPKGDRLILAERIEDAAARLARVEALLDALVG